jgi:hypothetical protein
MFSVILYMLKQTVGQRCLPLTLSIIFPLLLWRFLSSQLLCAHYTMWCCAVLRRDRLRHCCHHLSAIQPSQRCLTPWLRQTRALFAVLGHPPPPAKGAPRFGFGGEVFACCNAKLQLAFIVISFIVRSVTFGRLLFLQTVYSGSDAFAVSEQLIYTALLIEPGTPNDRPAAL